MTFEEYSRLDPALAPKDLSPALLALLHDKAGDWKAAHALVAAHEHAQTNRVHAYLHRKEGNMTNARHWYRRVDDAEHTGPLDDEWELLARRYLEAP